MKTIKILSATVCDGAPVSAGDVVEASPRDSHYLITTGKAVEAEKKPAAAEKKPKAKRKPVNKMVSTEDLETRDAGE